jgi:hypothetical protein
VCGRLLLSLLFFCFFFFIFPHTRLCTGLVRVSEAAVQQEGHGRHHEVASLTHKLSQSLLKALPTSQEGLNHPKCDVVCNGDDPRALGGILHSDHVYQCWGKFSSVSALLNDRVRSFVHCLHAAACFCGLQLENGNPEVCEFCPFDTIFSIL